ncbi:hypothetical protein PN36_14980 [Candidatus Thiomargarita nelsonii]|uniref:Uncharacterized protein n=1 Tax=Candidatus Thiomargarita nelsonii TaxID=1003181 RepID=A0A4E0QPR5_9GAMM|nr:hypothetical protein PN36_14965 [Candidatus Thiomargarita nelsonii]TGO02983.1 hypothetical protein PN36_14980 [Candidatus Thiomargarita nelsonii]
MYSKRVASHKDTIIGVHNNHFQFSELMKRGHIELSKAAVTAVAIVSPHVKKGVMYSNMLDPRQPSNSRLWLITLVAITRLVWLRLKSLASIRRNFGVCRLHREILFEV